MATISADEAFEILKPYHSALYRCFQEAWDIWSSKWSKDVPAALARDRRNALSMLIDQQFRTILAAEDGIRIRKVNERVLAYVQDRLILSSKYFRDEKLSTSNNPTNFSQSFDRGEQLEALPPFPRVCVGYRPDPLEQEISVFVKGLQLDGWFYPIGHEEPFAQVRPLFAPQRDDETSEFIPKVDEADEEEGDPGEE